MTTRRRRGGMGGGWMGGFAYFFRGNFQVHIFFEHFSDKILKPDFSKSSNLISTRLLIPN
jgi:hypothetical protein